MIAGTLRFLGFWLLAAAVIALIVDGTKTLASNALVWTPFAQTWAQINGGSLAALQGYMEQHANPLLWNPGLTTLLRLPTVALFSALSLFFLWAGRPRRDILE